MHGTLCIAAYATVAGAAVCGRGGDSGRFFLICFFFLCWVSRTYSMYATQHDYAWWYNTVYIALHMRSAVTGAISCTSYFSTSIISCFDLLQLPFLPPLKHFFFTLVFLILFSSSHAPFSRYFIPHMVVGWFDLTGTERHAALPNGGLCDGKGELNYSGKSKSSSLIWNLYVDDHSVGESWTLFVTSAVEDRYIRCKGLFAASGCRGCSMTMMMGIVVTVWFQSMIVVVPCTSSSVYL